MFALRSASFLKLLTGHAQQDAILAELRKIEEKLSDTELHGAKSR
jgi:hypothetical protein